MTSFVAVASHSVGAKYIAVLLLFDYLCVSSSVALCDDLFDLNLVCVGLRVNLRVIPSCLSFSFILLIVPSLFSAHERQPIAASRRRPIRHDHDERTISYASLSFGGYASGRCKQRK